MGTDGFADGGGRPAASVGGLSRRGRRASVPLRGKKRDSESGDCGKQIDEKGNWCESFSGDVRV